MAKRPNGRRPDFRKKPVSVVRWTEKGNEETGYSPDDVIMYAADSHGHRDRSQRFNLPPWMRELADAVVNSPDTPYRSWAGLMRDALYHRVHYWRETLGSNSALPDQVIPMLSRARAEDIVARELDRQASERTLLEGIDLIAQARGDERIHALERLKEIAEQVESIEEPSRSKILGRIKDLGERLTW